MDLEHANKALMTALVGIAAGKDHTSTVAVQPFGKSSTIFGALNNAVLHLNETFHADDLDIVDQAFAKLGLKRSSDHKDEVARALLSNFVPASR
jgi:hypothetical protein